MCWISELNFFSKLWNQLFGDHYDDKKKYSGQTPGCYISHILLYFCWYLTLIIYSSAYSLFPHSELWLLGTVLWRQTLWSQRLCLSIFYCIQLQHSDMKKILWMDEYMRSWRYLPSATVRQITLIYIKISSSLACLFTNQKFMARRNWKG